MPYPQMRLPADDPQILSKQLVRELDRLIRAGEENRAVADPWLYQAYLEKFLIELWMQVSGGNFQAPGHYLRFLTDAEDLIKAFLPAPDAAQPHLHAAKEVEGLVRVLEVADRCLAVRQAKVLATERQRPQAEREVLRVLFESVGRYLRRGEIYGRMSPRPTRGRVSQILSGLDREGLLLRVQAPAQGSSETSFFALSENGRELCRVLGIGSALISFECSGRPWRHLLRESHAVAIGENLSSGTIAAFYGHRRGVGRSLAVAHSALRLAKELVDESVLVVDLTFDTSELANYLGASSLDCSGLHGLIEGYGQQPETNRLLWLEDAIRDSRYVVRPSASLPQLYFLPLGVELQNRRAAHDFAVHLQREIGQIPRGRGNAPLKVTTGFWGDFREVLTRVFGKVLIDAAADLDVVAYVGTILLPDELLVFLRPNEKDFAKPRAVIGNFLWREGGESGAGGVHFAPVTFVLSMLPRLTRLDLRRTIDNLLGQDEQRNPDCLYRALPLFYDPEVAQGHLLIKEDGHWTRYSGEDLLTSGYQSLSDTLRQPPTAANWKIRLEQLERRLVKHDGDGDSVRRSGNFKAARDLRAKTPPRSDEVERTIEVIEAGNGAW